VSTSERGSILVSAPAEYAALVAHLIENSYINGELIRIDAGTRAPPR